MYNFYHKVWKLADFDRGIPGSSQVSQGDSSSGRPGHHISISSDRGSGLEVEVAKETATVVQAGQGGFPAEAVRYELLEPNLVTCLLAGLCEGAACMFLNKCAINK